MKRTINVLTIVVLSLSLSLVLLACAPAEDVQSASGELQISFKLDPRLLGPTYGGERWVPPPYGPISYAGTYTIEARSYYIDPDGRLVVLEAKWIPVDPELVTVVPDAGNQVVITIHGVGETNLLVETKQGDSTTLFIKSMAQTDAVRLVEISQ